VRVMLVVAVMVGGCGRIAFDAIDVGDAGTADAACTFGPFSAPVKLPGPIQSSGDDWFPTPTRGELELYFYRFIGASADSDIVRATRADTGSPFSDAVQVGELESTVDDTSVALTEDGLTIVLTRSGATTHMFEGTRASPDAVFTTPAAIFTTSADDLSPWLSSDGLRLTYMLRSDGIGDLHEVTRASRIAPWSAPVRLATLASPQHDDNPTLTDDGLEIFFSSDRVAATKYDVYHSTRASLAAPFDPPQLVPELSSAEDDIGTRLSRDGRRIYLNYNSVRTGGANAAIWMATRSCL
jgi:hypothetical protein